MRHFWAKLRLLPIAAVVLVLATITAESLLSQELPRRLRPRRPIGQPAGRPVPAPPNPLSKLFPNLLRGNGASGDHSKASEDDSTSGERRVPRDVVDSRIPHNAMQGKRLEQAEQLLAAGEPDQALERLEIVLNSVHATIRTPAGRPGLAVWEANRLLGKLPPSTLASYRLKHEAQARQSLRDARQSGNWDQVIDVATNFFHTESGQEAANSVGNFHFDRGEFGLASLWYLRLIESSAPGSQDPKWRLKAAVALREAGNPAASEDLLRRLRQNGADVPVDVGGDSVKPEAWLKRLAGVDLGNAPVLEEWLQFLGSARRAGVAAGSDPLLLSRWFHPSTQNKLILDKIESLGQDLADSGRAPIPTAFPLMVNDRIAFRTLRGVHVVNASTGQLLWETSGGVSEDALISGNRSSGFDSDDRFAFRRMRGTPWGPEFAGGDATDGHPLIGLLYRNANFGLLASDGNRLFVIEDEAVILHGAGGTGFQLIGDGFDGQRHSPSGNRLTAYDLATGRQLWTIGGTANREPFDLPLAGYFFFGAPLVDGGELFLVGEHDLDIRLFAIDAQTGRVRWSQLLAHSDNKIEQDLGRRWWTAQVAFSNGILVCPTTVDWLVGVDRLDHSVLWMHRFSTPHPGMERREREQGESLVTPKELNEQWCPSAPVIAGNHVIYTPAETPVLVCLDLSSGVPRWQFQKGEEQLYLAEVDEERVLVVGKSAVTALSLETGSVQWTLPIGEGHGPPSGRGVTANGKFYLPLRDGSLWAISLATGKSVESLQLLPGSKPLGNLAMYHGLLLSLNAFGLTGFEQRDAIQRQIVARRQSDPRDEWASVKQAEIALLHNDPAGALSSLDQLDARHVERLLSSPYRAALIDALTASVRREYTSGDRAIERLASVAETNDERLLLGRLQVEQSLAKKEYHKAFVVLKRLAETARPGVSFSRPEDRRITVDLDAWLAGQLEETWALMSPADRAGFNPTFEAETGRILRADGPARKRFVKLFGFLPAARRAVDALVDECATEKDMVRAERLLLRLIRRGDRVTAAAAQWRLAGLYRQFGLEDDADSANRELASRFAGIPLQLPGNRSKAATKAGPVTADRYVESLEEAGLLNDVLPTGPNWGNVDLKMYRFGTNYMSNHIEELELGQSRVPFFQSHRFSVDERRQRLEIVQAKDDAQQWLLPLRMAARARQGEYTVGIPAGHQLAVMFRDVLHYLDPVGRRVLWTHSLEVSGGLGSEYRAPHGSKPEPLRAGSQFASRHSLLARGAQYGMLAAANTEYVCLYGRREFLVLDAETGDVRWKCSGIPPHSTVFGNEDVVYLVPPDRSAAVAFCAADGKRLDAGKLGDLLVNAIAITPEGLVTVDATSTGVLGLEAPRTIIRLVDPTLRKERWKIEYPGGTNLTLLDGTTLLAVSASGDIERVNLTGGQVTKFQDRWAAIESRKRDDLFAIADRDRVYLISTLRERNSTQYPEGFRPLTIGGGGIAAFDGRTGKALWNVPRIPAGHLVLDFFHDSPMLLFASRVPVQNHQFGYWSLRLLVLDKQTGRTVLSTSDPSTSQFRTIELNMAERYIELRSYNQRLRLIAVNTARRPGK